MFEPQLGKNIEVYIADMVVKSKLESKHVNDLGNIFEILRRHKMQLNASKCSFGIESGSSWATWSHTIELKSTLTRLRQSIIYNYLRIPKRSRT